MSFVSSSLLLVSSEAPGNAFFTHTLRCPQQCQQSESSWSTMDNIIPNKYRYFLSYFFAFRYLEYLLMGAPSGPMRNFSKFQAMSVLLTGRQIRNCGLAIRLSGSSLGAGRDFFRNLKTGCSFSPLASTCELKIYVYMKISQALGLKCLPCQTILLWTQTHFQV